MKKFTFFLIIIILVGGSTELIAQDCANEANIFTFTYNGIDYEIVKENLSWFDAAACAVERGGILAEIDSQEEQDTIFYYLYNSGINVANTVAPDGGNASYVWIGGNDIALEGMWIWDGNNDGIGPQFWEGDWNGTPIGGLYNNWGGEPDNWSNQDGLGLALTSWPYGDPGQWNDIDEFNTLYYVIEHSIISEVANNENVKNDFFVYPNPAKKLIHISFSNTNNPLSSLKIMNSCGIEVWEDTQPENSTSINIIHFVPGVYVVQALFNDGTTKQEKILVR